MKSHNLYRRICKGNLKVNTELFKLTNKFRRVLSSFMTHKYK